MEDIAKINFGKALVSILQETQAAAADTKPQLCMHRVHLKGLCSDSKFCLAFTVFAISEHK